MGSRRQPVRKLTVLGDTERFEPAGYHILNLQVGAVGEAHGHRRGHQIGGALAHSGGQHGALATGQTGARVDPKKEHRLCANARDGHRTFSAALAGVGEGIGDGGHLFQCDGDGRPCGGRAAPLDGKGVRCVGHGFS